MHERDIRNSDQRLEGRPGVTTEPALILLVEDNPDHAELIVRSFEDHPIKNQILHLSDGEAALDYLLRHGGDGAQEDASEGSVASGNQIPRLMILDLRLPKVDGLEVLRQIRTHPGLDDLPIVVLSTSKAETDVDRAYDRRANSFLVKPLDFVSFTSLITDLGYYWLGWNHFPGRRLGDGF